MKIPPKLKAEFMGWMAAHDDDDAPDGAWFAMLEQAGDEFLETHNIRGRSMQDGNDAAHYYLASKKDSTP